MNIPSGSSNKALIIVDVQPSFLNSRNQYVVKNILELLASSKYALYIVATFNAEKGSLWDIQQNWICPKGGQTQTVKEINDQLKELRAIRIEKQTKSVFKGAKNPLSFLQQKNITEVHVVGLDTNDCVLATAYEAFDLGFITYVIEECCQSSSSDKLHQDAVAVLRAQNMTNNSILTH